MACMHMKPFRFNSTKDEQLHCHVLNQKVMKRQTTWKKVIFLFIKKCLTLTCMCLHNFLNSHPPASLVIALVKDYRPSSEHTTLKWWQHSSKYISTLLVNVMILDCLCSQTVLCILTWHILTQTSVHKSKHVPLTIHIKSLKDTESLAMTCSDNRKYKPISC